MYTPTSALFRRPSSFPDVLSASLLLLGRHSDFLGGSCVSVGDLSSRVVVFCLPSIGVATPELAWLSTAPACRSYCVSSPGGGQLALPECPGARFVEPDG
jgi:hypothetical protein